MDHDNLAFIHVLFHVILFVLVHGRRADRRDNKR